MGSALAATVVLGVLVGMVTWGWHGPTPEADTVVALESAPLAAAAPVPAEVPGVARAVSPERAKTVPAVAIAPATRPAPPVAAPTSAAPAPAPAVVGSVPAAPSVPSAPVESVVVAAAPAEQAAPVAPAAARLQAQPMDPLQPFTEAASAEALGAWLTLLAEQTRGTWRVAPVDAGATTVQPSQLAPSTSAELTLSDARGQATLRVQVDSVSVCRAREVNCWRSPLSPEQRDAVVERVRALRR